jgi:hypothetical protein
MRSPKEIRFRLRQEAYNLWQFLFPPQAPEIAYRPLKDLPDPVPVLSALRSSAFGKELEALAGSILQGDLPLLGLQASFREGIPWRRDWLSGKESGLTYFRRIPYLDLHVAGDHKIIWELNRHQHLVVLAQAYGLTGRRELLQESQAQLASWWESNPYLRGINWTSALEVAFRALSWIWIYHLTAKAWEPAFHRRFLQSLYEHAHYLSNNLSVYFSPNTHLLGELVALHAVATLFPEFDESEVWRRDSAAMLVDLMSAQVKPDGSYFEQSTYYHVYALDLFLLHYLLAGSPPAYRESLQRMAHFLATVQGAERRLPLLGDDDGGRTFHPYGDRRQFGRATLATASLALGYNCGGWQPEDAWPQAVWWLGRRAFDTTGASPPAAAVSPQSAHFRDSGLCVMYVGDWMVIFDAGPFGPGGAGHSHSDTLSVLVRRGGKDLLHDAGTYTYVGDAQARNWFRGSAAHNTIRINQMDQAPPSGPFRWARRPDVRLRSWQASPERCYADAICEYDGFQHRRRVLLEPECLVITDELSGSPAGPHLVEQFWHPPEDTKALENGAFQLGEQRLTLSRWTDIGLRPEAWRSEVLGARVATPVICASQTGELPLIAATVLSKEVLSKTVSGPVTVTRTATGLQVQTPGLTASLPGD